MCLIHYCTRGLPQSFKRTKTVVVVVLLVHLLICYLYILLVKVYMLSVSIGIVLYKCILHSVCYDVINYIRQIYK